MVRWVAILSFALCGVIALAQGAAPAVVNPVLGHGLREVVSLDGDWEFTTDPKDAGHAGQWYLPRAKWPETTTLRVPGSWEAQGVGGPGDSHSSTPEAASKPLRGTYTGTAWYRKRVRIPETWQGRRVWLAVGGVNAQGWFWVDGQSVAHVDSYCGTYKVDITAHVKPGRDAVIVAKVRNDVPSRKGLFNWIERFGGLYRSVELQATPDVLLDRIYTIPDFDNKRVQVVVDVRSATGTPRGEYTLRIAARTGNESAGALATTLRLAGETTTATVALPLAPFHPWSPEDPALYELSVILQHDREPVDELRQRFGVRKIEVRGNDFYLNNERFYLRGYGDDFVYPIYLASPPLRDFHAKHFRIARDYGFNYVRLHTHCELPEYFDAADEAGIMVQPELPYYGGHPSAGSPEYFMPGEDLAELVGHYRDHVSLTTYCTGNEGWLGTPLDKEIYEIGRSLDPTRLFLHQDGGRNLEKNSDFDNAYEWRWDRSVAGASDETVRPRVMHEFLNLATEEDPRWSELYSGTYLSPRSLFEFETHARAVGLPVPLALSLFDSGQRLQSIWQKRGMEACRLDPRMDGQIYWTITDVGAPYSGQGLLSPFWGQKASTPAFFRQFNAPTVLLAERVPSEPIFASGDILDVTWALSHFGAPLPAGAALEWELAVGPRVLRSGSEEAGVPGRGLFVLGRERLSMPSVDVPRRGVLRAEIPGTGIANAWDLWIFPAPGAMRDGRRLAATEDVYDVLATRYRNVARAEDEAASRGRPVHVTGRFDADARRALQMGRDVLLLSMRGWPANRPGAQLNWWELGAQTGTALLPHPSWGDFPHDELLSPVMFRLLDRAVQRKGVFEEVEPLMIGQGRYGYLISAFQTRVGQGRLLATGLDVLSGLPEADFLLGEYVEYVQSRQFRPEAQVAPSDLPDMLELNGLSTKLNDSIWEKSYDTFLGKARMWVVRQDAREPLIWLTDPVQSTQREAYTFRWVGGMGYVSQPEGSFVLSMNGRTLLRFGGTRDSRTWRSPDGFTTLRYTVVAHDREDSSGVMELSVPAEWVVPGEPAVLTVEGSDSNSRRWFAVYDF